MLNPAVYENSLPGGVGRLEVITDSLEKGRALLFVPLRRSELTGQVAGPLASLRLRQVFRYSREECDAVLEAVYRFPLPGDAAVTGIRVSFGQVEIEATLQEREAAEAEYARAREEGRAAALTTREAPDVFTLHVAGLRPDEEIRIETDYVQLLQAEGAGWSLRVPLTIAPRYVRSDELDSRHAHGQALLHLRDPGHRFVLDLTLEGAEAVESGSHRLCVTGEGERLRVRLAEGAVVADRDLVLTWQVRREEKRPHLQVLLHNDQASDQTYFLALLAPPAAQPPASPVPREVILLVDHSGSMEGPKWEAADWVVEKFLGEITEQEWFSLGLFHHQTRWFSRDMQHGGAPRTDRAVQFLRQNRDSGGTELGAALEQALALPRREGDYARHVLIITDAQVSDEGRILRLAAEESQRDDRRRISMLCVDAAPNSFLAREIAARGGGVTKFLTSDPQQEDISTALEAVLADWEAPLLSGLYLDVNRPGAMAAGRGAAAGAPPGWSRIDLGDLPAGRPVWVVGRVPRDESKELLFCLTSKTGDELARCALQPHPAGAERPAAKALFGARQVLGLEFLLHSGYTGKELHRQLRHLGYDPAAVLADEAAGKPRLYAENTRREVTAALRSLLVREALYYGLASMETAFVAVRREAGEKVAGYVLVGNALPAGWSEDFLDYGDHLLLPPFLTRESTSYSLQGPDSQVTPWEETGDNEARSAVLFAGVPLFEAGQAVLYDSGGDEASGLIPAEAILRSLQVRFPEYLPAGLDPAVSILIFLGDLCRPRVRVRLADLLRHGGERPLHIARLPGQALRVILEDPRATWPPGAFPIEVSLAW